MVRWPDQWFRTLPPQGSAQSLRRLKEAAEEVGCEVVFRERGARHQWTRSGSSRGVRLVILGAGNNAMGVLLDIIRAAESVGTDCRAVRRSCRQTTDFDEGVQVSGPLTAAGTPAAEAAEPSEASSYSESEDEGAAPEPEPGSAAPEPRSAASAAPEPSGAAPEPRSAAPTPGGGAPEPGGGAPEDPDDEERGRRLRAEPFDAVERLRADIDALCVVATESANAAGQVSSEGANMKLLAEAAIRDLRNGNLAALAPAPGGLRIALCSTCFAREAQTKLALPLQLLFLLPWRNSARLYLVTFGDDRELCQWIRVHCSLALRWGLLEVASGGRAAGEDLPQARMLRHWHASVAKNASHVFALSAEVSGEDERSTLERVLLVNLDGDNVFEPSYVEALINGTLKTDAGFHTGAPRGSGRAASGECGLTGRMTYHALDFMALGGYDEEEGVAGMGFQDVDLLRRLNKRAGRKGPQVSNGCGFAFPQGATRKLDRGFAKICHMDPAVVTQFKTWGNMNKHNAEAMIKKTTAGRLLRNFDFCPSTTEELRERIGAVWFALELAPVQLLPPLPPLRVPSAESEASSAEPPPSPPAAPPPPAPPPPPPPPDTWRAAGFEHKATQLHG